MRSRSHHPCCPMPCIWLPLLFLAAGLSPIVATATTYVVAPDGSGDYPTIQAAVDACSYGDTIELTDGTFTGPGNRDILVSEDITIRAQNGPTGYCIIDCQGSQSDQHFGIEIDDNGGGARLEGFTIQNAWVYDFGGALHALTEAVITIDSCIFWNNYAELGGGAIEATTGCEITINSCFFAGNRTNQGGPGGAIYADDAVDIQINDCGFNGNWGDGGGALYLSYNDATLTNCTINGSDGYGAALHADNYSSLWVYNTIISFGDVAAVRCTGSAGVVMYCCDIYGNAGGDWTGCIMSQYGMNGNISEDPLFCWPYGSPFGLAENSPCAPDHNPSCGLIGAYEVDCGPAIYPVQADGLGEYPTIQAAIDAAAEGSIVELADGVYRGAGNRDLDFHGKALTVRSATGHPSVCVINCEGSAAESHRGFHFHSGEGSESIVQDIKVIGGYIAFAQGGGAILCENHSSPTLEGCTIYGNAIPSYVGGGVACVDSSNATLSNCQIYNNEASRGAGLYCASSDPQLTNCTFQSNNASLLGGGICALRSAPSLLGCTLRSNEARTGGGICLDTDAHATVLNCDFVNNTAYHGAGFSMWESDPYLADCTFLSNTATGVVDGEGGGGMGCVDSRPRLEDCTFTGNEAPIGGAVSVRGDSARVEFLDCMFAENTALFGEARGGAVYCEAGDIEIDNSDFHSNFAEHGGGVYLLYPGSLNLTHCHCDSNAATIDGGVIHAEAAYIQVDSCQFVGNLAPQGGALWFGGGENYILNSTFEGNSVSMNGGAMYFWHGTPTILSCTLTGNEAPNGSAIYCSMTADFPIENTIIAFGSMGSAIAVADPAGVPAFICTDIYGNAGGDWVGEIADQFGFDGNISLNPLFCGLENPEEPLTLESISPCAPENNTECGLIGAYGVGCSSGSDVPPTSIPIAQLSLSRPSPNPSSTGVRISYTIPDRASAIPVTLQVVDATGRLVHTLIQGTAAGGHHEVAWDGRDGHGRWVDAGIYYCQLRTGIGQIAQRITIVR